MAAAMAASDTGRMNLDRVCMDTNVGVEVSELRVGATVLDSVEALPSLNEVDSVDFAPSTTAG
jgi:hypothetical protein